MLLSNSRLARAEIVACEALRVLHEHPHEPVLRVLRDVDGRGELERPFTGGDVPGLLDPRRAVCGERVQHHGGPGVGVPGPRHPHERAVTGVTGGDVEQLVRELPRSN